MKRLLIALMALSLVLVAVSFASAQINLDNLEEILYVEAVQNILAPFEASIPGIQVILQPYQTLSAGYLGLSDPQTFNDGDPRRCERDRHERERHKRCERERHERERHHFRCEWERHECKPYETGQYAWGRR